MYYLEPMRESEIAPETQQERQEKSAVRRKRFSIVFGHLIC
jgi:hypothetical protein